MSQTYYLINNATKQYLWVGQSPTLNRLDRFYLYHKPRSEQYPQCPIAKFIIDCLSNDDPAKTLRLVSLEFAPDAEDGYYEVIPEMVDGVFTGNFIRDPET